MGKAATASVMAETGDEAAEIQAAIRQMFARMDEINLRIERDQADIDRLKGETRAMLAELTAFSTQVK